MPMSKFIVLSIIPRNQWQENQALYCNVKHIISFHWDDKSQVSILNISEFYEGSTQSIWVKQSPDEILKLIEEA